MKVVREKLNEFFIEMNQPSSEILLKASEKRTESRASRCRIEIEGINWKRISVLCSIVLVVMFACGGVVLYEASTHLDLSWQTGSIIGFSEESGYQVAELQSGVKHSVQMALSDGNAVGFKATYLDSNSTWTYYGFADREYAKLTEIDSYPKLSQQTSIDGISIKFDSFLEHGRYVYYFDYEIDGLAMYIRVAGTDTVNMNYYLEVLGNTIKATVRK